MGFQGDQILALLIASYWKGVEQKLREDFDEICPSLKKHAVADGLKKGSGQTDLAPPIQVKPMTGKK